MKSKTLGCVRLVASILGIAILEACTTPSVHPIYTSDDEAVIEPGLVGTWKPADGKETYAVSRDDEDSYRLLVTSKDATGEKQWTLSARLVKLGDATFADITAADRDRGDVNDKWGALFVATHMFVRWSLEGDSLTVRMLKREWLEDASKEKKASLAHTRLDGYTTLITAETPELQAFLKAHANDDNAFANTVKLERVK